MKTASFGAGFLFAVASILASPDTRALIEQALKEPASITLDRVRLKDAMEAVTEQTGVRLIMQPDTMRLVPNGPDTLIERVEIANVSLAQGLEDLFGPLGMNYEVRDDYVEIVAKEALRCLGRPPTWVELDTLSSLAALEPGMTDADRAALRSRLQFHVPRLNTWGILSDAMDAVGAGPGDEVLTIACRNLGWAWCLSEEHIVITPMQEQVRRQLKQPISLRMNNQPLFDVMQAIGRQVNVDVRVEPGALASLPIRMQQNFSVNVYDLPVDQVLEKVAAYAGLGFYIEPDGVYFYRPPDDAAAPAADSAEVESKNGGDRVRDPYIGKITVPLPNGMTVEWLIRRSELPEDLQARRADDLMRAFDAIREQSESP